MRAQASALVLEDNRHMQVMLTQLLHTLHVEQVDAVATLTHARDHLALLAYDLALIDVGLDHENGLDLIRGIRLDPAHPARRGRGEFRG